MPSGTFRLEHMPSNTETLVAKQSLTVELLQSLHVKGATHIARITGITTFSNSINNNAP
jgi:hypothetical protein